MVKLHQVRIGDDTCTARSGQIVLDAAMLGGVDLPHDCRAGRCGGCMAKVKQGITLGGETREPGTVHACQARVFSDLALEVEEVPGVVRRKGKISALCELAEDVFEVTVSLDRAMEIYPGQYCKLYFRGHPFRSFSPTRSMTSLGDDGQLRFHIKRLRGGRVTPQVGVTIRESHGVSIEGPFGRAFLRPALARRLVLVGRGTGFAPVWALAVDALRENPLREIFIIASSHKIADFYMAPALELLGGRPNVRIVAAIEELVRDHRLVSAGRALDHIPALHADDIIYACGSPKLVDAVSDMATAAGALFYADTFEATAPPTQGWLELARVWLKTG